MSVVSQLRTTFALVFLCLLGCEEPGPSAPPAACSKHTDCPSLLCTTYDGPPGQCIPRAQVVYVDNTKSYCAGGRGIGTLDMPLCQLPDAMALLGDVRPAIRLFGSATSYGSIAVSRGSVGIYGPDEGSVARIDGGGINSAVAVTGGDVLIERVEITQGRPGIACSGASTRLILRRSRVLRSAEIGVRSTDCDISVERTLLAQNNSSALILTGATRYRIVNNFVVDNNTELRSAITIENGATGTFKYNTVANNRAAVGVPGAIDCSAVPHGLSESIFAGNSAPMIMGTTSQLFRRCDLTNVVVGANDQATGGIAEEPNFVDATNMTVGLRDYRLTTASTCCRDRGKDLSIKSDYFGSVRPSGAAPDIGAHEL